MKRKIKVIVMDAQTHEIREEMQEIELPDRPPIGKIIDLNKLVRKLIETGLIREEDDIWEETS